MFTAFNVHLNVSQQICGQSHRSDNLGAHQRARTPADSIPCFNGDDDHQMMILVMMMMMMTIIISVFISVQAPLLVLFSASPPFYPSSKLDLRIVFAPLI